MPSNTSGWSNATRLSPSSTRIVTCAWLLRRRPDGVHRRPRAVLVCGAPRGQAHNYLTASRTLDYAFCLGCIGRARTPSVSSPSHQDARPPTVSSVLDSLDWDGGTLVEDMDLTVQIHRKRLGRIRYAVTPWSTPRTRGEFASTSVSSLAGTAERGR